MSLRAWWKRWRTELRHRQARDTGEADFALSATEVCASAGRFIAGAHGVGLAVSASMLSASYTSLTTVDMEHICFASRFVSGLIGEENIAAWQFFFGGSFAVVVAGMPRGIWAYRNIRRQDMFVNSMSSLPFESWAKDWSEWRVKQLSSAQMLLLFGSFVLLLLGLGHAMGLHLRSSPEAIQSLWHEIQAACPAEP